MYFDSNTQQASDARVQVGIEAAVVAHHHVCVRAFTADGRVNVSRFQVPPTLTGLATLTKRLSPYPDVLAVAEPTSMTWLGLAVAYHKVVALTFDAGANGDGVNAILATLAREKVAASFFLTGRFADNYPSWRAGWPRRADWATTPQTI